MANISRLHVVTIAQCVAFLAVLRAHLAVWSKNPAIFHRTHTGFAMQYFNRHMRDGHRSCVGNCICQLYLLGIGNSFYYEIMMKNRVTKSDDKSSGTIS